MESSTVVVFPLPVIGHITPMLHFAARLVSQGLKVTFVTTRRTQSRVLRAISETMPDSASTLKFVSIPDDQLEEQGDTKKTGIEAIWEAIALMHSLRGTFERLLKEILDQEQRVACLVSDFLLDWTGEVAAKFHLPRAAFWTSNAAFLLLMIHAPDLVSSGCVPLREETKDEFIPYLEGVPRLRARELPFALHADSPADPGFKLSQSSIRNNLKASWVVTNTFDEIEVEAIAALRQFVEHELVVLGPVLPSSSSSLETAKDTGVILKWLNNKKKASVLYISFGTVAGIDSMRSIEELARGLEVSGIDFVWVFRTNLVEDKDEDFMEKFQERTKALEKGLVVPWAPQLQVLQHNAVGGFLTHCGWNSVLESIWSGVPMLGWPCMAEQNLNQKFITDIWKIGVPFDAAMDATAISSAVVKLMQGKEGKWARKSVARMRIAGQRALAPGGTSHKSLEEFVESLKLDRAA
ncbi:UDP-glycosyltransferase 85A7 [Selaginella moellendorffii]|uniref:UDP-glycosyltransferase 85A7 n=1 Tax=Selaginella moellendorffii TaxID=88036 RepID=UPI000D1C3784|nr:UDP-glycosyltransferase 85A7 [Selaginella moellendorffii]|eukprot:XP_024526231.1 UDP-glycosyltransferase 85A7 [Selaginella moellendorffii]